MENVKKENKTLKKALNILFYVVIVIVFVYAMFALFSQKEDNSINFLGISSMSVQSDSMFPTFKEGDLIFIKTDFDVNDLVKGDVITYRDSLITSEGLVEFYNTHRIDEVVDTGGLKRFITKGDNNLTIDARQITSAEIYGVWTGRTWAGFGSFADGATDFLKSSLGFFLFIVVPCLALLVYEVVKFMKVYSEYNVHKHTQDRVKMQEEALAVAKAQLEAEAKLRAEQEKQEE